MPPRPLSEHIATLGAAEAAQTANSQPHIDAVKTPKPLFAAIQHASTEHSLGEMSNGLLEQRPTYSADVDRHQQQVENVPRDEYNQQMRPTLVQAASADNGLLLGNNVSSV